MNLLHLQTGSYPISLWQLRQSHPNVSFAAQPTDDDLAPHGYANVLATPAPAETREQRAQELPPERVDDGTWRQAWELRDATPEELAAWDAAHAPSTTDYYAFWDALLVSSVYQSIRAQALSTPAVLMACTEFVVAVGDAKAGRPNPAAIQACINYLLAAATLTEDELVELGALLAAGGLQEIYALAPAA